MNRGLYINEYPCNLESEILPRPPEPEIKIGHTPTNFLE